MGICISHGIAEEFGGWLLCVATELEASGPLVQSIYRLARYSDKILTPSQIIFPSATFLAPQSCTNTSAYPCYTSDRLSYTDDVRLQIKRIVTRYAVVPIFG
jgi:hypothetical protein